MTHTAQSTSRALREAADRLVAERSDLPPGSVLRSFSKSVRTALLRGCPFPEVAAVAELLAQQDLAQRPGSDDRRWRTTQRTRDLRVPRPRTVT